MTALELHHQIGLIQGAAPPSISVTAQSFPEEGGYGFLISADVDGMDSTDDLFDRMEQIAIMLRDNILPCWIVRAEMKYSNGFCRVGY